MGSSGGAGRTAGSAGHGFVGFRLGAEASGRFVEIEMGVALFGNVREIGRGPSLASGRHGFVGRSFVGWMSWRQVGSDPQRLRRYGRPVDLKLGRDGIFPRRRCVIIDRKCQRWEGGRTEIGSFWLLLRLMRKGRRQR